MKNQKIISLSIRNTFDLTFKERGPLSEQLEICPPFFIIFSAEETISPYMPCLVPFRHFEIIHNFVSLTYTKMIKIV